MTKQIFHPKIGIANKCSQKGMININNTIHNYFVRKTIIYEDSEQLKKSLLDTFYPLTTESYNYKHWVAVLDFKTCKICRDNHGKILNLNQTYEYDPPIHYKCR